MRTPTGNGNHRRRFHPAWATAATIGLLLAGFSSRYAPLALNAPDEGVERDIGGRGRNATTPSQISGRGWRDILLRVYQDISSHRILAIAAGVTFYGLLAVFPAVAALVSIYGLFVDPTTIASQADQLGAVLPGGAIDVVRDQMTRVASQGKSALGVTFVFGLVIALWSANAGTKALFDALNVVYNEQEKRGFIKLNAISLLFTSGVIVFLLVATTAVVALPALLQPLGFGGKQAVVRMVVAPFLFAILVLALAVLYRYGPSRDKPRWRWISWGSVSASVVWLAASMLFSWYAANFGTFNKTYGSLGAVVGFMTWIWLSAIVILVGGELNAEMEHQTAQDTTSGRPEPMGRRGATMADTVGAPQS
jgi:membrane protein